MKLTRENIFAKMKNGEELTREEVQFLFWEVHWVDEVEGEHHRWWHPVDRIYYVDEEYYLVWGMIGLTECQEDDFEPQVAQKVKRKEVVSYEWVPIEE